ncbi:MAG TPA: hypothetical protein VG992_00200 [Candidatus Saccharimonadales bacterium]|nr:hypothetical protein [Candidatus Saccharimonadales bacterium]
MAAQIYVPKQHHSHARQEDVEQTAHAEADLARAHAIGKEVLELDAQCEEVIRDIDEALGNLAITSA